MAGTFIKCNIKTRKILDEIKKQASQNNGKIVVKVGINEAEGVKTYDGEKGSPSVAQVATWQEYGWTQRVTSRQSRYFFGSWLRGPHPKVGSTLYLPPRPFIRGTVSAEGKKWFDIAKDVIKSNGIEHLHLAAKKVGAIAAQDMRMALVNGGTSEEQFPRRSPLTIALYGAFTKGKKMDGTGGMSGDKPLVRSSLLLDSITYQLE